MINVQNYKVRGYQGMEVFYTLIKNNRKANKLAILLPGADYSVDKPLFHYITNMHVANYVDVLHIHYQYEQEDFCTMTKEELLIALKQDTNAVVSTVLNQFQYDEFLLISKSLGSIALSNLSGKQEFKEARLIWLTPLIKNDEVFTTMKNCTHKSLSIMGTTDPNYNKKRYNELKEKRKW